MKNKIDLSSVSPYQRQLLQELSDRGVRLDFLDRTDVIVAEKNKQRLFFIDEYTPLVPHNIGLILTNRVLVDSVLKANGIKTSDCRAYINQESLTGDSVNFSFPLMIGSTDIYRPLLHIRINSVEDIYRFSKVGKDHSLLVVNEKIWKYKLSLYYDRDGFFNALCSWPQGVDEPGEIRDVTRATHKTLKELAGAVLASLPGLTAVSFTVNIDGFDKKIRDYAVETILHTCGYHYQYNAVKNNKKTKVKDLAAKYLLAKIK
jgi:hypothetical protein